MCFLKLSPYYVPIFAPSTITTTIGPRAAGTPPLIVRSPLPATSVSLDTAQPRGNNFSETGEKNTDPARVILKKGASYKGACYVVELFFVLTIIEIKTVR